MDSFKKKVDECTNLVWVILKHMMQKQSRVFLPPLRDFRQTKEMLKVLLL